MKWDLDFVSYLHHLTGVYLWSDNLFVFCAEYLPWLVITAFLIWVGHSLATKGQRLRVLLIAAAATIIARFGAIELIRLMYERPRPFLTLEFNPLFTINEWSFPSGHASVFAAIAMTVFLHDRKWGIRFFIATAIIVLARIVAGVHYLTDIVAGLVLGSLIAFVVYKIARRISTPKRRRR